MVAFCVAYGLKVKPPIHRFVALLTKDWTSRTRRMGCVLKALSCSPVRMPLWDGDGRTGYVSFSSAAFMRLMPSLRLSRLVA
jgi:hypothetical protein